MAGPDRFQKLVAAAKQNITEIAPAEAAAAVERGEALLIDVRSSDDWKSGHAAAPSTSIAARSSSTSAVPPRSRPADHLLLRRRQPERTRRREPARAATATVHLHRRQHFRAWRRGFAERRLTPASRQLVGRSVSTATATTPPTAKKSKPGAADRAARGRNTRRRERSRPARTRDRRRISTIQRAAG